MVIFPRTAAAWLLVRRVWLQAYLGFRSPHVPRRGPGSWWVTEPRRPQCGSAHVASNRVSGRGRDAPVTRCVSSGPASGCVRSQCQRRGATWTLRNRTKALGPPATGIAGVPRSKQPPRACAPVRGHQGFLSLLRWLLLGDPCRPPLACSRPALRPLPGPPLPGAGTGTGTVPPLAQSLGEAARTQAGDRRCDLKRILNVGPRALQGESEYQLFLSDAASPLLPSETRWGDSRGSKGLRLPCGFALPAAHLWS